MIDTQTDSATPGSAPLPEQACPACGAAMPVFRGYVTWCDTCNWNLQPSEVKPAGNLFGKLYDRVGKRMSADLYRKVVATGAVKPGWNRSKIAAFALATLVHALVMAFAVGGVWMVTRGWPNILMIFLGTLSICIAIVSRPRPGKPAKVFVDREEFAHVYAIVDEIAGALGAPKVDVIILNQSFNASFGVIGWRRQRELRLGIPLMYVFNAREFTALVGHELGHSVNGDSTRSLYLKTTISSLDTWYRLLKPKSFFSAESGGSGILMLPFNIILAGMAQVAWAGSNLMAHLVWRNSQRAEYLADYLSSVAAGRDASMAMLDKLHLSYIFEFAVQKTATGPQGHSLFGEFTEQLKALPKREMERVRRASRLGDARLDTSHPPTGFRVDFMKERGEMTGRVNIGQDQWNAVRRELFSVLPTIQKFVIDTYAYHMS